jgi:pre-mRNA-splicing helicase BRR2
MAEEFQRSKLYEYRTNSNLVLEADRDHRRRDEATGEVETLHGRINSIKMGERVVSTKNPELTEKIEKLKRAQRSDALGENDKKTKKSRMEIGGSNVLAATEDLESINYKPRTRESRIAYEEILSFVSIHIGDQPQDILRGAAEEILAICKDENMRDGDRQREVSKILPQLPSERYNKLLGLSKRINDFNTTPVQEDEVKMDEEMGVAVVFDDDDDEGDDEEGFDDEVHEDEDGEDGEDGEEGVETHNTGTLHGEHDEEADAEDKDLVSVHDIDAHWLQRQLSRHYADANLSSSLAEQILVILQVLYYYLKQ